MRQVQHHFKTREERKMAQVLSKDWKKDTKGGFIDLEKSVGRVYGDPFSGAAV